MVNFEGEATVGIPAAEVEKITILQRRFELFEALEDYNKNQLSGRNIPTAIVKASLRTLFLEIQAMLKRRYDKSGNKENYHKLRRACMESNDMPTIINAIYTLNEDLDKIKLTMIDTQRQYDSTNVEEENKIKGYD